MKRTSRLLFMLVAVSLTVVCPMLGQESGQTGPDEMMAAMAKAGEVGSRHERLAAMAGTFDVTMKMWMDPTAEPMSMSGVANRSMMLAGRVMVEKFDSEFMGQKFEGFGMTGFDNVEGAYWSTWCDNMSTSIIVMKGECSEDGANCTFAGMYKDPATGVESKTRFVSSIVDGGDRELMTSYMTLPDGSEMKNMEFVYTRRK